MVMRRIAILLAAIMLLGTGAYAADCNSGGRYEDMGDGTIQDCRTGLIWLKDANCMENVGGIDKSAGTLSWYDAQKWVAALSGLHCGLNDTSYPGDWRLPTRTEMMAMLAYAKKAGYTSPALTNAAGTAKWTINGDAFNNVQSGVYWLSTTYNVVAEGTVWCVSVGTGSTNANCSPTFQFYVWPVRGGQQGSFGNVILQ